uniref:mRNA interferase YafQ n=1 Tax=Candidatus Kentrum sp. LPFa TaxID=2126335 RepID=A0A450VVA7_9GAMM|nr:MAG: mRNA interferase YafQ [Candidatus Kentron sp. LPFa]
MMSEKTIVHAKINKHIKKEAATVLATMGLTVSDALSILLTRIAREKAFPFEPLAHKHRDHALTGDWKDHRDCHVRADLILIYRKPDDDATLQLVRLGSHSELGL